MPKIIESKLVLKAEDRASDKLRKVTEELGKVAEALSKIRDGEAPEFVGGRGRAILPGGARVSRGSERSQHAPPSDVRTWGRVTPQGRVAPQWMARGPTGAALGYAGVLPRVGGQMIQATAGGAGLAGIGGLMQQIGGPLMGAFAGFGAIAGLPMLAAGVTLGLAHMLVQPGIGYYQQTYGPGKRLGRGFVDRMRSVATGYGIAPTEFAQYLPQLERFGAQAGVPALGMMRGAGITPELAMPLLGATTRAGGAGRRSEAEYTNLAKLWTQATRDIHSIPEFLDQLVGMTEAMTDILTDMHESGTREVTSIARWMQQAPTAALRGARGAKTFGQVMNWIAAPGEPGKEMYLWGALAPHQRSVMESLRTAGPEGKRFAGLMEGADPYLRMRMLRERPEAFMPVIRAMAREPGGMGEYMLMSMGLKAGVSRELMEHVRMNPTPDTKWMEKKIKEGAPKDPAEEITKLLAKMEEIRITLTDVGVIHKVLKSEEGLLTSLKTVIDTKAFTNALAASTTMAHWLELLATGKTSEFFKEFKNAVRDGMREAFDLFPVGRPSPVESLPLGGSFRLLRETGEFWGEKFNIYKIWPELFGGPPNR